MCVTRKIAFSAVFAVLAGAGAVGCSSLVNVLRDGVVRDERVTQVTFSGDSGDITTLVDAAVKGIDIRRRVLYPNRAPSIADTIQFAGGVVTLSTSCGEQCTVSNEVLVPVPGLKVTGRNDSGDLTLHGASDVDIEAGSGDVTVDGATGTVRVRAGSGDVKLTGIAGPATVTVGSGDVTGHDLRGTRTSIEVSSGDITLNLPGTGDVTALTGSGDIHVNVPDRTCRVVANAGSGDLNLEVNGELGSAHVLELRSGSGDISVRPA